MTRTTITTTHSTTPRTTTDAQVPKLLRQLRAQLEATNVQVRALSIALSQAGAAPPMFGNRTPAITEDAADLVDKHKDADFHNAPFTGDTLRVTGETATESAAVKAMADEISGHASVIFGASCVEGGALLKTVVDVVDAAKINPLRRADSGLAADSTVMRRKIDAHYADGQTTRQAKGSLRTTVARVTGENARLAAENQVLRSGQLPEGVVVTGKAAAAPAPARRARARKTKR